MSDALADAITRTRTSTRARLRVATVTATSPLTIALDGGSVAATRLAAYTPTNGDIVAVIVEGNHILVLGVTA